MPNNGLADLNRRWAAIPKAVRAAVEPALEQSANELVSVQKRLAPIDDGTLRASIRQSATGELKRTVEAGGPTTTRPVRAGYDFDYAIGTEFGTRNSPAHPFFWPGYRLVRKRIRNRVKRAITQAVKKHG